MIRTRLQPVECVVLHSMFLSRLTVLSRYSVLMRLPELSNHNLCR